MIEPKLYMGGHCMVLYKFSIFMWRGFYRCLLLQDKFNIGPYRGNFEYKLLSETTETLYSKSGWGVPCILTFDRASYISFFFW